MEERSFTISCMVAISARIAVTSLEMTEMGETPEASPTALAEEDAEVALATKLLPPAAALAEGWKKRQLPPCVQRPLRKWRHTGREEDTWEDIVKAWKED
jgi:hypothetical protein